MDKRTELITVIKFLSKQESGEVVLATDAEKAMYQTGVAEGVLLTIRAINSLEYRLVDPHDREFPMFQDRHHCNDFTVDLWSAINTTAQPDDE